MNSFDAATIAQLQGKRLDVEAVSEALDLHLNTEEVPSPFMPRESRLRRTPCKSARQIFELYRGHTDIYERCRNLNDDMDYWIKESYHWNMVWHVIEQWNCERRNADIGSILPGQMDPPP